MNKSFKINPKYLVLLVFAMIGLSFASVPLYDLFCRITGFGGTTQKAEKSTGVVTNKIMMSVNGTLVLQHKNRNPYNHWRCLVRQFMH